MVIFHSYVNVYQRVCQNVFRVQQTLHPILHCDHEIFHQHHGIICEPNE